jgi:hypothetical protein
MEPLWSPAVATGSNRWQMGGRPERLKQAKTVAVGCDRLPEPFHGKEGVDGSSPSEGLRPAKRPFLETAEALLIKEGGRSRPPDALKKPCKSPRELRYGAPPWNGGAR